MNKRDMKKQVRKIIEKKKSKRVKPQWIQTIDGGYTGHWTLTKKENERIEGWLDKHEPKMKKGAGIYYGF